MCNKFKLQHHEVHPYWTSHVRELNSKEQYDSENSGNDGGMEKDVLAVSTEYLKNIIYLTSKFYNKIKQSKVYCVLTNTTQPAHVAIMLVALLITGALYSSNDSASNGIFCKFVYIATTAAHFGSQIWMTFASGLSLYFSLPRHHFGEVQKILFPLYFTITSILSLATLLTHFYLTKSLETSVVLSACFLTEFIVRLYLCDPLVSLICIKNEIEAKYGLGMEVGKLSHDSALFECQEYITVHKRFRRLHMFIAFSNIACIGFSTAHLYMAVSDITFGS